MDTPEVYLPVIPQSKTMTLYFIVKVKVKPDYQKNEINIMIMWYAGEPAACK